MTRAGSAIKVIFFSHSLWHSPHTVLVMWEEGSLFLNQTLWLSNSVLTSTDTQTQQNNNPFGRYWSVALQPHSGGRHHCGLDTASSAWPTNWGCPQRLSLGLCSQCCCCPSHREMPGGWFYCTEKVFLLSNFYKCLWRSLVADSLPSHFGFSFYSVFSILLK